MIQKSQSKLKDSAIKHFDKNAHVYDKDNYSDRKSRFMINRHNAILDMINDLNFKFKNILDIGCGPGEMIFDLSEMGLGGIGIDTSAEMIKICQDRLNKNNFGALWKLKVGDAENTELDNNSHDLIIASGLIEYLEADSKFLSEMNRILKSDGFLILNITNKYGYPTSLNGIFSSIKKNKLLIPFFDFLRKKTAGSNYGINNLNFEPRKHNIKDFRNSVNSFGFEIIADKYVGFQLFPAPISTVFEKISLPVDKSLENLNNSFLKHFFASYIICLKKIK